MKAGSLVVVGSGIRLAQHCTPEARAEIAAADVVYAVMSDALGLTWLQGVNANVVSLKGCYGPDRSRRDTYDAMRDTILDAVRQGRKVCAVFYGHPGIYVTPSHEAVRAAEAEGFLAVMLPGISAEDCLWADLGVDPGHTGAQSYEATDFIINERRVDTSASLVLWQIGVVGEFTGALHQDPRRLQFLSDVLCETYPAGHRVIVYEASTLPVTRASIQPITLGDLAQAHVSQSSTLYVPPLTTVRRSSERLARLKACLA